MVVDRFTLRRLDLPLKVPYKLALGTVEAFDTLLVEARGPDGASGYGEATILEGYTEETVAGAWRTAAAIAARVRGLATAEAKAQAASWHEQAPFVATAFVTALEMLESHPLLADGAERPVPLLAVVNATEPAAIAAEVATLTEAGYDTLKLKVGFDVARDLAKVRALQQCLDDRARVRLDGNQGFSRDEALAFVAGLEPRGIELLEQPCAAGDWDAAVAVARASAVPMMLDESIYGLEDVRRAAQLGCAHYIKFKLMKAGGVDRLLEALELIRELGMKPVLGNGVASDIGCWMEACVAHRMIDNAGEMNGFLKPRTSLLATPLQVSGGAMNAPPARELRLSDEALAAATVAETTC